MTNPNKLIRDYFKASLARPVYDTRQATEKDNLCFLLLDQNNLREDETKCYKSIVQNMTIEAIERVPRFGNAGSRDELDQMTNEIYTSFDLLSLTGYQITGKNISDNSVITYDRNEIINRNILTLTFKIQEDGTN